MTGTHFHVLSIKKNSKENRWKSWSLLFFFLFRLHFNSGQNQRSYFRPKSAGISPHNSVFHFSTFIIVKYFSDNHFGTRHKFEKNCVLRCFSSCDFVFLHVTMPMRFCYRYKSGVRYCGFVAETKSMHQSQNSLLLVPFRKGPDEK